jgi:hypothetical protein
MSQSMRVVRSEMEIRRDKGYPLSLAGHRSAISAAMRFSVGG